MIELKGIVREYRNGDVVTPALTGIDLCIGKGEFAAVMGASGSGKTTLLHIIGCMDAPTSGIYRLDGEHLERASEKRLSAIRGQKISFVFQHFALLEDCTAAENVALPLLRQRMSGAERRAKVLAALEQVGIADPGPPEAVAALGRTEAAHRHRPGDSVRGGYSAGR